MLKIGNLGVITTLGEDIYEITGIKNGLVYCVSFCFPKTVKVCLPDQFWVLLDNF